MKRWMKVATCPFCRHIGSIRINWVSRRARLRWFYERVVHDFDPLYGGWPPHCCKNCDWQGEFKRRKVVKNNIDYTYPGSLEYLEEMVRETF